jgi:hypothetical protein
MMDSSLSLGSSLLYPMRRAANVSPRLSPNLNLLDRGAVGRAEQRYGDHPVGDLVECVFLAIVAASTKRSFGAPQQVRHLSVIAATNSVRPVVSSFVAQRRFR